MKYRKRQDVQIDAMQWDGTREGAVTIKERFESKDQSIHFLHSAVAGSFLSIKAIEGCDHHIHPLDWVLRGVEGEIYGVAKSVFEKTYEKV